jgi:hypothetical protein
VSLHPGGPRARPGRRRPSLAQLEFVVVTAWSVYWLAFIPYRFGFVVSWHFFIAGARRLVGLHYPEFPLPGGLHLYANYPKLQIGPLSFVVALPLALLPRVASEAIACALMVVAGPLTIGLIAEASTRLRPWTRQAAFRAGVRVWFIVAPLWCDLAIRWGHLDDVLTLLFVAAAVNALSRARPGVAALCIGAAAAAKPWGIAFIPLALAAGDGRRLRHLVESIAVAAGLWLPFLLADSHTLRAGSFKIRIVPTSVLAVFHLTGGTPSWVRPCQFLGGALLVFACVQSGRWAAAVVIAIALRLGTDPNVYSYYTTGLLVGAAIWDLLGSRVRAPLLTAAGFIALYWSTYWSLSSHTQAVLRLAFVLAVPVIVLATAEPRPPGASRLTTTR